MTDQELKDKISQVFEDFEDPSAEHGWHELRKKYPERQKRPILVWWGAAAAVLLMVCGLWFLVPDTEVKEQKITADKTKNRTQTNKIEDQVSAANSNREAKPKTSLDTPAEVVVSTGTSAYPGQHLTHLKESQVTSIRPESSVISPVGFPKTTTEDILKLSASKVASVVGKDPGQTALVALPQLSEIAQHNINGLAERDSAIDASARLLALAQAATNEDDHKRKLKDLTYTSQKMTSKGNTISFYAGTYVNYATGSETKVNFGAGFTSDIKLGDNLSISTGLALANNSLTYNNGVPSNRTENLTFDLPNSFAGNGNNNLTTVTKYDASLLALDIPVNIKYLLIPKDNKLYMLAGLSSGTYLNEKYSLSYRKYSTAGVYVGQNQGSTIKTNLQAFDFARTLNISFGYSTNLGKTQNISIEPFLKYPLGGLGSENLRFGSTGLNLKLNFSSSKK